MDLPLCWTLSYHLIHISGCVWWFPLQMRALTQRQERSLGQRHPARKGRVSLPSQFSWIPNSWLFPAQPAPLRKETLPRNMPGWHCSAWEAWSAQILWMPPTLPFLWAIKTLSSQPCLTQAGETARPPEVCTLHNAYWQPGGLCRPLTSMVLCSVALNRVPQTQMCKGGWSCVSTAEGSQGTLSMTAPLGPVTCPHPAWSSEKPGCGWGGRWV